MLDTDRAADLRDRIEADLADAVAASVRRFLNRLRRAARNPEAVVAAATNWLTLGETMGWWAAEVDQELMARIGQAWQQANRSRGVAATSLDQAGPFLAQVRDRLVRGLEPGLPEDAFNRIRETLAQSVAQGWSHPALQRRIAEELAWSSDKQYWQQQLGRADDQLNQILDAIGPPGDPVRELYRKADPDGLVQALQADRSHAILQIEREDSWWQVRAERIARTESTAAYNHGALQALAEEGFTHKQWLAAEDNRTRPSHAEADGQTVPLEQNFVVGGYTMMMPGDPNAPGRETINCRCTLTGAEGASAPAAEDVGTWATQSSLEATAEMLGDPAVQWADEFEVPREESARRAEWRERARQQPNGDGAWQHYTGGGYGDINGLLRAEAEGWDLTDGPPPKPFYDVTANREFDLDWSDVAAITEDMDALVEQTGIPLPADSYFVRGISPRRGGDYSFTADQTVTDPAFLSVTTDADIAARFRAHDGWTAHIRAAEGTRVIPGTTKEAEWIFGRGSVQRIVRVDNESRELWLEIVE